MTKRIQCPQCPAQLKAKFLENHVTEAHVVKVVQS